MNPNAQKWVEALESGRFKQGTRALAPTSDTRCCLGVACELAIEAGVLDAYQPDDGTLYPYPEVTRWLGLRSSAGSYGRTELTYDNDSGKSFAEIAQIIRTHPELFVDGER